MLTGNRNVAGWLEMKDITKEHAVLIMHGGYIDHCAVITTQIIKMGTGHSICLVRGDRLAVVRA